MACYTIPLNLAIIIASDIREGKQAHYAAAEEAGCLYTRLRGKRSKAKANGESLQNIICLKLGGRMNEWVDLKAPGVC